MRYFSRIRLDIDHPRAIEALHAVKSGDVYRDHQWLWRFFSNTADMSRDFVFRRMDPQGQHEHPVYYVVSRRMPVTPHAAWIVDGREYAPRFQEGDGFSFELRVNPVITRDGHRHDIVMDGKTAIARESGHNAWKDLAAEQQAEITDQGYQFVQQRIATWLIGENDRPGFASRNGFSLKGQGRDHSIGLRTNAYCRHRLPDKDRNGRPAWFTSIDLSGVLVVTDVERFQKSLYEGVGHAKAFGCGLLLIRRI